MDQQPQQSQPGQQHPGQPYPQQGFQQQAYPQDAGQPYGQAVPYYQQRPAEELGKRPASATFAAILYVVVSSLGFIQLALGAAAMVFVSEVDPEVADQAFGGINTYDRVMMVVQFVLMPICIIVGIMLFSHGKVRHRLALALTFVWVIFTILQPILGTDPMATMEGQGAPDEMMDQMETFTNIGLIVSTLIGLGIQGAIIGCLLHARRWYDEA